MNDSQAMQQIEAGMRVLFDNYVQRAIEAQPDLADELKAITAGILSGGHGLIFQVEIHPVAGCDLNCGVALDRNLGCLVRLFDGHPAGIWSNKNLGQVQ